MNVIVKHLAAGIRLMLLAVLPATAADYNLQTLEEAQTQFKGATNASMYAEAAKQYEILVHEEGIRNGHLFYNIGNSWFMAEDFGRAILNYRRAEHYLPHDANLRHNLMAALELRTDLIPKKESHPLAARLLGWHLNTSTAFRWWLFACAWILFWGAWFWTSRTTKNEARITALAAGAVALALLASLAVEFVQEKRADPGVVIAPEVLARKGDGDMYALAFLEPLHSGTEFQTLEQRGAWLHVRLDDGQTCWIPARAGETVALR